MTAFDGGFNRSMQHCSQSIGKCFKAQGLPGRSIKAQGDPVQVRLERSRNVGYTFTVPPAVPNLSPLLRREPRRCVPLHTLTSSSGKIRRRCVDRLNPPPKAEIEVARI